MHIVGRVPGQYSVACMQHHQSRDPDPLVRVLGEIPNEYPQPGVGVPAQGDGRFRFSGHPTPQNCGKVLYS